MKRGSRTARSAATTTRATETTGVLCDRRIRPDMRESLRAGGEAGALLTGLGVLVWATGLPALFPSLGPSAYALVTSPGSPESRPRRVVGGHVLGVLAGLLAYHGLAGGTVLTAVPPATSTAALRLAASGVLAVALTTAAMLATDYRHSPACATTLIVALGLLSTPSRASVVVVSVVALVLFHRGLARTGLVDTGS